MVPRFSIATLLLLTALIAMGLGWYLDHRELSGKYKDNKSTLQLLLKDQAVISNGLKTAATEAVDIFKAYALYTASGDVQNQLFNRSRRQLEEPPSLNDVLWVGYQTVQVTKEYATFAKDRLSKVEIK